MVKAQVITDDVIFFLQDSTTKAIAQDVIEKYENIYAQIFDGGVEEAANFLKTTMYTKIVVVDASKSSLIASDVEKLTNVCSPETTIIILGKVNDVSIFRDLMKLNIADYLVKPLNFDILTRALNDAMKRDTQRKRSGKIIGFMGVKGGVGTSTLVTNSAYALANVRQKKVALIDGDIFFGHIPLMLDLRLSHALSDAIENPERIDDIFLEQAMSSYGNHLRILSSEEPLHGEPILSDEQHEENFNTLINTLKSKFHYILLDMPRHSIKLWKNIASEANMLFITTDLSAPSLRDLVRIKNVLAEESPTLRLFTLVNQIRPKETLALSKFEKYLGSSVDLTIPYFSQADHALNMGVPLSSTNSNYLSYIQKILERISGEQKVDYQSPLLSTSLVDTILSKLKLK